MDEEKIIAEVQSCIDCMVCLDVCDTFIVTQNELLSPNGRLKIVDKIFGNLNITQEEIKSIYTCTLCGLCDLTCQQSIHIADAIHSSKIKLVEMGLGPLENHNKIIKNIEEQDNSVSGKREERLNWIPEKYKASETFETGDSDTLLFLGCMSSFRVKESASASYELLKEGNFDFKIFEKEPCCGEYVYSAGKLDFAQKIFSENFELFKQHGIKNIITTCGGCFYAFNNLYPKYIRDYDIPVKHVIQVIHELEKKGKLKFQQSNDTVTYHDSCRTGRKIKNIDVYDEPRELLNLCATVNELKANRELTGCCGAGSGIRGVDSSLSIKIGKKIFDELETQKLISSCPLCVFNYRYVNYKTHSEYKSEYITDYLLEALKKE